MADAGIYALTKAVLGGVSAVMTGPMGSLDLPPGDLEAALTASEPGMVIELVTQDGQGMGLIDTSQGGSPGSGLLHPDFVSGLIATEDARFHEHPGVDPFAILSALADRGEGRIRGGSSLTQQAVKNEILGSSRTLERKILEGIISVRAVHELGRERILDGYLAKSWFGRGVFGVVGAPRAWFAKTWDEVTLSETALLIGLLKGPARYDPARNPDLARDRRDAVLSRMLADGVITRETAEVARAEPIQAVSGTRGGLIDPWVESAVLRELEISPLPASDAAQATLTIDPAWQSIVQEAVSWGAERVDGVGPAGVLPPELLVTDDPDQLRAAMTPMIDTTPGIGRALVTGTDPLQVLVDRGFGPLEPDTRATGPGTARVGEVYAYRRQGELVELIPSPRANAAAVVMEADTGAILAVVGGANPEMSRFDRSLTSRQVGSAIKPFLWARALEAGIGPDAPVPDLEASYVTSTGEIWSPRNYDRRESGWIPLFTALENSSNNVAANLVARLGVRGLAEITEAAGVYPGDGMRQHPSSALGASEARLIDMAAGYASIANGGVRVVPHAHTLIRSDGALLIPEQHREVPVMTRGTASLVSSMLYGVTTRGTAAGAFGPRPPIAGKTGTTQSHRDAWFMGFGPDLVIGVWVGRDDNAPLPVGSTGASTAAPIAARIIEAAERAGLSEGFSRSSDQDWPPVLLQRGAVPTQREDATGALVFEPDPEARRRAIEGGADPFKNSQELFDRIRNRQDVSAASAPLGQGPDRAVPERVLRAPPANPFD